MVGEVGLLVVVTELKPVRDSVSMLAGIDTDFSGFAREGIELEFSEVLPLPDREKHPDRQTVTKIAG